MAGAYLASMKKGACSLPLQIMIPVPHIKFSRSAPRHFDPVGAKHPLAQQSTCQGTMPHAVWQRSQLASSTIIAQAPLPDWTEHAGGDTRQLQTHPFGVARFLGQRARLPGLHAAPRQQQGSLWRS